MDRRFASPLPASLGIASVMAPAPENLVPVSLRVGILSIGTHDRPVISQRL